MPLFNLRVKIRRYLPADMKERQQFPMEVRNIVPGSLILVEVLLMDKMVLSIDLLIEK